MTFRLSNWSFLTRIKASVYARESGILQLTPWTAPSSSKKPKKQKKPREPSPPPPEIDKAGEMPAGSEPVVKAKKMPKDSNAKHKDGLKGIEIGDDSRAQSGANTPLAPAHFEEYREDEVDEPLANGTPAPQPVPVALSEVQVVRVKRKKKKAVDGASKKKTEA